MAKGRVDVRPLPSRREAIGLAHDKNPDYLLDAAGPEAYLYA